MKLDQREALRLIRSKLGNARRLIEEMPGTAAQQAYLAMHAAATLRIAFDPGATVKNTHSAVQATLHNLYRESLDENPGKQLSRAYQWKQTDDYGGGAPLNVEQAIAAVAAAETFVERMLADAGVRLEWLGDEAEANPDSALALDALAARDREPSG